MRTLSCSNCKQNLMRIPHNPLQRILLGSSRYACVGCGKRHFKFLFLLF